LWIPLKEGIGGESRPKDRVKTGVTFQITLMCLPDTLKNFCRCSTWKESHRKKKKPHITNSILKRLEGRQWHYQQLRMLLLTVVGLLLFLILENHNWNLAANFLKCSFTLSEQTSTVFCGFSKKICIALSKRSWISWNS
jgi:hypothetical protein